MRLRVLRIGRNKSAVAPAFAEVLMVVMTAGMAASLFFMYSGIASEPRAVPTHLALADKGQVHADAPGYCCLNDTLLEVSSSFGEPRAWESGLQFQILGAGAGPVIMQGDLLAAPADPAAYYVGVYHGSPDEASIVNVGYVDLDRNSVASAPDHIEIRGMSKEYHSATFNIVAGVAVIATQVLP